MTSESYAQNRPSAIGLRLSLVCEKWKELAERCKLLVESIHLLEKEGDDDWTAFTDTLVQRTEVLPLVRHLRFTSNSCNPMRQSNIIRLASVCKNIVGLEICIYSEDPLAPALNFQSPLVRNLHLPLLECAQTLQYLVLALNNLEGGSIDYILQLTPTLTHLNSLGLKLNISDLTLLTQISPLPFENEFPSLRNICVDLGPNMHFPVLQYINKNWRTRISRT